MIDSFLIILVSFFIHVTISSRQQLYTISVVFIFVIQITISKHNYSRNGLDKTLLSNETNIHLFTSSA